jgi:hypothetical protein
MHAVLLLAVFPSKVGAETHLGVVFGALLWTLAVRAAGPIVGTGRTEAVRAVLENWRPFWLRGFARIFSGRDRRSSKPGQIRPIGAVRVVAKRAPVFASGSVAVSAIEIGAGMELE